MLDKYAGLPRTAQINLRISEQEKQDIKRAATKEGLDAMSAFVMQIVRRYMAENHQD